MQFPTDPKLNRVLMKKKPAIGDLMDLCGENYALLLKMAPSLPKMKGHYQSHSVSGTRLHLQILEQSRYTSLIRLTYFFGDNEKQADPDSTLRVYHDSSQLELIDLRRRKLYLTNTYQHPNLIIKWKANLFIHKWLIYCLKSSPAFEFKHTDQIASVA